MSNTFVAVAYDDMYTAQEVRLRLLRMQKEYLIDLEDAVVAVRDEKGKVKLHQIHNLRNNSFCIFIFHKEKIGIFPIRDIR